MRIDDYTRHLNRFETNIIKKQLMGMLGIIGQDIKRRTIQRGKQEVAPSGKKWKPLSKGYEAYKRKARGAGKPILEWHGRMIKQIQYKVKGAILTVFPTVNYAEKHQLGLEGLPARPFLDINDEDETERKQIDKRLNTFFDDLLKRI